MNNEQMINERFVKALEYWFKNLSYMNFYNIFFLNSTKFRKKDIFSCDSSSIRGNVGRSVSPLVLTSFKKC